MAAARICDIGVAIDAFSIRISIYMCMGLHKDGFYFATIFFFCEFAHETCVKWNVYRTEFCGCYVMRTVYFVIFNTMSKQMQQDKFNYTHQHMHIYTFRVSQEECARLREGVPYVKVYRYNPKHLYPKLNSYGDNGQRSLKL